jgi:hypothetical protein
MDASTNRVERSELTFLSVALDAIAVFVSLMGWTFILWLPCLLVIVLVIASRRYGFSLGVLFLLILAAAVLLPFGMFLKWLSHGIVERARIRTGLVPFVLTVWGTYLLVVALLKGYEGFQALQTYVQGVALLLIAIVCFLAFARREEL